MNSIVPRPIADQPWALIGLLLLIVGFGATVLYSAAGGNLQPWSLKHLTRFGVFLTMALILSRIPKEFYKQFIFPGYLIILIMLIGVELLGAVAGGSQRWLDLGFIRIQPSELMKPALVAMLALFFDRLPVGMTHSWRAILPAALIIGVPAFLVMLQPDLGTGLAIAFGGLTVMFLAGLPLRLFIGGGLATAAAIPFAYFFLLREYQQRRVLIFLDPENDPLGAGYHITQSKIAIGSGGVFGKGFLNGSQSHLDYLPEGHTDFVFATMAEEWGLLGGIGVLLIFGLILHWGMRVSIDATDRFSRLLAAGLTTTVFFYIAINLLMVMGLAPVVGIPLPFLSHGGSSMMTIMICLGMVMAADRWNKPGSR